MQGLKLTVLVQVTMLDSIPGLINAIRMINSYSRYYNTSEHMFAMTLTCPAVRLKKEVVIVMMMLHTQLFLASRWDADCSCTL